MRLILISVGLAVTLSAQAPRSTFEVASVKQFVPPGSPAPAGGTSPRNRTFFSQNTVAALIQIAYNITEFEVVGGPDWIRTDRFVVNARSATELSFDEKRPLVQALLEDRFKLVLRKGKQEMRFAELVLARSDGRLGPNATDCLDPDVPLPRPRLPQGAQVIVVRCGSMAELIPFAVRALGMPVVDKTGLTGRWHMQFAFLDPRFATSARAPAADPDLAELPTAFQEQLGVKVEFRRGPFDVLVVESVEQPTPD